MEENNSGFTAGQTINLLLHQRFVRKDSEILILVSNTHVDVKKFSKNIHSVCRDHVKFLAKVIIQSHVWTQKKDQRVLMQTYEVGLVS